MISSRSAIALALLALSAACSSSSDKASTPPTSEQPSPSSSSAATTTGGGDAISIASFAFSKATVAPGATVTVTNSDSAEHTVTSEQMGLFNVTVDKGTPVTFKAPAKAGDYAYVCSIHASMHGTLTVKG